MLALTVNEPGGLLVRRLDLNIRQLDPGHVAFVEVEFDVSVVLADMI
jgi:hypothetical protein